MFYASLWTRRIPDSMKNFRQIFFLHIGLQIPFSNCIYFRKIIIRIINSFSSILRCRPTTHLCLPWGPRNHLFKMESSKMSLHLSASCTFPLPHSIIWNPFAYRWNFQSLSLIAIVLATIEIIWNRGLALFNKYPLQFFFTVNMQAI